MGAIIPYTQRFPGFGGGLWRGLDFSRMRKAPQSSVQTGFCNGFWMVFWRFFQVFPRMTLTRALRRALHVSLHGIRQSAVQLFKTHPKLDVCLGRFQPLPPPTKSSNPCYLTTTLWNVFAHGGLVELSTTFLSHERSGFRTMKYCNAWSLPALSLQLQTKSWGSCEKTLTKLSPNLDWPRATLNKSSALTFLL